MLYGSQIQLIKYPQQSQKRKNIKLTDFTDTEMGNYRGFEYEQP